MRNSRPLLATSLLPAVPVADRPAVRHCCRRVRQIIYIQIKLNLGVSLAHKTTGHLITSSQVIHRFISVDSVALLSGFAMHSSTV